MLENSVLPLYYLCSLAGLLMVAGGIWLIYREKIYIDRATEQVTEIWTPPGKFKTNVPALALFALGFVPLIYPIYQMAGLRREIKIRGNVRANLHPIIVYAVAQSDPLFQDGDFNLQVPILNNTPDIKILFIAGGTIDQATVDPNSARGGIVELKDKIIALPDNPRFQGTVAQLPPEFGSR